MSVSTTSLLKGVSAATHSTKPLQALQESRVHAETALERVSEAHRLGMLDPKLPLNGRINPAHNIDQVRDQLAGTSNEMHAAFDAIEGAGGVISKTKRAWADSIADFGLGMPRRFSGVDTARREATVMGLRVSHGKGAGFSAKVETQFDYALDPRSKYGLATIKQEVQGAVDWIAQNEAKQATKKTAAMRTTASTFEKRVRPSSAPRRPIADAPAAPTRAPAGAAAASPAVPPVPTRKPKATAATTPPAATTPARSRKTATSAATKPAAAATPAESAAKPARGRKAAAPNPAPVAATPAATAAKPARGRKAAAPNPAPAEAAAKPARGRKAAPAAAPAAPTRALKVTAPAAPSTPPKVQENMAVTFLEPPTPPTHRPTIG